jgi:uncharacterized protein (TIGR00730 family)
MPTESPKRSKAPSEATITRDAVSRDGTPARSLSSICVFCGSGPGRNPAYVDAARALGAAMARSNVRLVYGGGSLGLMGEVARAVLADGGKVTGIIPEFLREKERMLREVDEMIVTEDMHERKRLMFERSDAFVALPGGIGTLEELVEQLTWAQLGRHDKPIVVVNVERFWDPLKALLSHMRDEAFIRAGLEVRFNVVNSATDVVPVLNALIAAGAGSHVPEGLAERF